MALVAKCAFGRPTLCEIKRALQSSFHLAADVQVSTLDSRHILLLFVNHSDFVRVWLKELMVVKGFTFRFFKWTRFFKARQEAPMVSVWVSFPNLPINLYHGNFFSFVVGAVGKVLKVDGATVGCTRTVSARACVEVDVRSTPPEKIWIGGGSSGFSIKLWLSDGFPSV
ncbi:uncharacterized protein LOC122639256 [Telopea speciosissima]|uniref:uncharacterized protein LOC122639256 n=1 Tax=Telopea speciosissima TaxID=54955 RepID=UPI001CC67D46|nr:uncharacterized protein LOC122639256 [Telopea speciosissima]